jgi:pilus assembly protein CpaF
MTTTTTTMETSPGQNRGMNFECAKRFQRIKMELHRQMIERLDMARLPDCPTEQLRRDVRKLARSFASQCPEVLSEHERTSLASELEAEVFGLGPLESLMNDPSVSDILVNGPDTVFVERHGVLDECDVVFADDDHLMQVIQRVAGRIGRRIDGSTPMVDARLPDGSRVHAIVPPLALDGAVLSIRRFPERLTASDMLANSTMPEEVLAFLKAAVEGRASIIISGGTGAGKTTLLNALSRFIPIEERLVTIEESAELQLQQRHVVRLETRIPNMEGDGEVTARQLVRNSLRMRPDRIIVGEVRGPEALDMLQAMNTGHEGSLSTIHANSTRDALSRLETMVVMAGYELTIPVIRQYISSALQIIVQIARLKGGARRVVRVTEIIGLKKDRYILRELFSFRQTGVEDGKAIGYFHASGKKPKLLKRLAESGISLDASLFEERTLGGEQGATQSTFQLADQ